SAGGEEEKEETDRIIEYVNSAEYSGITFPVSLLLEGRMGVEIRRDNVDLDVVVNTGTPYHDKHRELLESKGFQVQDVYGETEYPEGAMEKTIQGVTGFDLSFNSQINLVYDTDSNEFSYEGTGRFGYLPFGIEGQAMPGVYLSGIKGTVELVEDEDGNEHQLLVDFERAVEPDKTECSDLRML
ncbi:MAG: hypothetical protein SXQ77_13290, partial [Halobacteria archaeon]|nr:hypothetical protein [Halobacteria archaeon]